MPRAGQLKPESDRRPCMADGCSGGAGAATTRSERSCAKPPNRQATTQTGSASLPPRPLAPTTRRRFHSRLRRVVHRPPEAIETNVLFVSPHLIQLLDGPSGAARQGRGAMDLDGWSLIWFVVPGIIVPAALLVLAFRSPSWKQMTRWATQAQVTITTENEDMIRRRLGGPTRRES